MPPGIMRVRSEEASSCEDDAVADAGFVLVADLPCRLIEDLYADEAPPRALAALHAYVSHLRRALEPGQAARARALAIAERAHAKPWREAAARRVNQSLT